MLNSSSRNPLGSKPPGPAREIFTKLLTLTYQPTVLKSLLSLKKRKETHLETEEKRSRSIGLAASSVRNRNDIFWQYYYCYHEIFITLYRI